jgi:hypothetical protein
MHVHSSIRTTFALLTLITAACAAPTEEGLTADEIAAAKRFSILACDVPATAANASAHVAMTVGTDASLTQLRSVSLSVVFAEKKYLHEYSVKDAQVVRAIWSSEDGETPGDTVVHGTNYRFRVALGTQWTDFDPDPRTGTVLKHTRTMRGISLNPERKMLEVDNGDTESEQILSVPLGNCNVTNTKLLQKLMQLAG